MLLLAALPVSVVSCTVFRALNERVKGLTWSLNLFLMLTLVNLPDSLIVVSEDTLAPFFFPTKSLEVSFPS